MGTRAWMGSAVLGALMLAGMVASANVPTTIDRIIVFKSERKLLAMTRGRIYRTYRVALGKSPLGAKRCRGDNRTPEGEYYVTQHRANSRYFLALELSYPSEQDIERARSSGCHPGGGIEIHGLTRGFEWLGKRHREQDWTNGCIALTNEEILELYRMVLVGTRVEIYP